MSPADHNWRRPAWALLFIAAPLCAGFYQGPAFIDDAFISFRYAAKLAAGEGFAYNSTPIFGATAPFYVLLLAGLQLVGVGIPVGAFLIGVLSAAAAPVLSWRAGMALGRPLAGVLGGLLLSLFPSWWLNSKTGMETTLAGMLAILVVLLDLRKRSVAAGVAAGLLVLTRPDAALLPLIVFLVRVREKPREGLVFAAAALAVALPWVIFSAAYFGSPLPQSLAAKRLIHPYPWYLDLAKLGAWFGSATAEPPLMLLVSLAFVAGAVTIVRHGREGLALALWPPLFLVGLAATGVGAFFWYKYPMLPVYFLGAGVGFAGLGDWAGGKGRGAKAVRTAAVLLPLVFIAEQLLGAVPWYREDKVRDFVAKEDVLREMAARIRGETAAAGLAPAHVRVLAGEVGVLGYELLDWEMLDSAGINSREVYELRRADWERERSARPESGWQEQWWGSPEWSRELIRRYRPGFIASNRRYLHLAVLAREPAFQQAYRLTGSWSDKAGEVFVLFERRDQAK